MLAEIFELLEKVVMFIIPVTLIYLFAKSMYDLPHGKWATLKYYKWIFCLTLTIVIITGILTINSVVVYQMASIWTMINNTSSEVTPTFVKSASFFFITFIWQAIGAALLFVMWEFVFFRQIISGEGTVKQRITSKLTLVGKRR